MGPQRRKVTNRGAKEIVKSVIVWMVTQIARTFAVDTKAPFSWSLRKEKWIKLTCCVSYIYRNKSRKHTITSLHYYENEVDLVQKAVEWLPDYRLVRLEIR